MGHAGKSNPCHPTRTQRRSGEFRLRQTCRGNPESSDGHSRPTTRLAQAHQWHAVSRPWNWNVKRLPLRRKAIKPPSQKAEEILKFSRRRKDHRDSDRSTRSLLRGDDLFPAASGSALPRSSQTTSTHHSRMAPAPRPFITVPNPQKIRKHSAYENDSHRQPASASSTSSGHHTASSLRAPDSSSSLPPRPSITAPNVETQSREQNRWQHLGLRRSTADRVLCHSAQDWLLTAPMSSFKQLHDQSMTVSDLDARYTAGEQGPQRKARNPRRHPQPAQRRSPVSRT